MLVSLGKGERERESRGGFTLGLGVDVLKGGLRKCRWAGF